HVGCTGMLTHVRESLLDGAEHSDALGGRERVRIAADLEPGRDSCPFGEGVDLAVQDLAEGPRDDALRFQGVRDLPELPVELDETCAEVVEAAVRLLAVI